MTRPRMSRETSGSLVGNAAWMRPQQVTANHVQEAANA